MKRNTARGTDGLKAEDLMNLPKDTWTSLFQELQKFWTLQKVPPEWYKMMIRSIAKVAKPTHADQFRPVTMISMGAAWEQSR